MGETAIEWTDVTWNPIRGCSRVSEGCRNCYAERTAIRQAGDRIVARQDSDGTTVRHMEPGAYAGLVRSTPSGPRWTGEVRFVEEALKPPLSWKKPRRVFVNSMSDLFHEKVADEWIDDIFAVMAQSPTHTFQILTKRPERMREYLSFDGVQDRVDDAGIARWQWCHSNVDERWPLPNVHLGVSVENDEALWRVGHLLQTPAAVRFLSVEPLLGPVEFTDHDWTVKDYLRGTETLQGRTRPLPGKVDWVIVGGESGPGARPCDVAWIRSVVAQCRAAGVPCFVKQLGAFPVYSEEPGEPLGPGIAADDPLVVMPGGRMLHRLKLKDKKGGDMTEWPWEDLRVREFPVAA